MIMRYNGTCGKTLKVLFVYPNLYMMNMMPPAIAVFSALLKQKGIEVALFDTTYYPWDHAQNIVMGQGVGKFDLSSDKRKENNLQVRPFDLADRGIKPKDSDMLDDFKIVQQDRDLPKPVWDFLRKEHFFAMIIGKEYGGLDFSPAANSYIVSRIASRSISAAVSVMVPNFKGVTILLQN